jgi:hypothetical protein
MSLKPLSVFYLIPGSDPQTAGTTAHATTVVSRGPFKFVTLMTVSVIFLFVWKQQIQFSFIYNRTYHGEKDKKETGLKGQFGQD